MVTITQKQQRKEGCSCFCLLSRSARSIGRPCVTAQSSTEGQVSANYVMERGESFVAEPALEACEFCLDGLVAMSG